MCNTRLLERGVKTVTRVCGVVWKTQQGLVVEMSILFWKCTTNNGPLPEYFITFHLHYISFAYYITFAFKNRATSARNA